VKPFSRIKVKGIKQRWMLTGIAIILVIVIVAVTAFSISMAGYYYQSVRTGLVSRAHTSAEFFTSYVTRTYAEYYQSAWKYAEEFEDKDKLELQLVNTRGRVDISSYGITAGSSPGTPDIASALETGLISVWTGRTADTRERIMAVSSPLVSISMIGSPLIASAIPSTSS